REQKAHILSKLICELSDARSVADKIPNDASALGAALDVLDHVFGGVHVTQDDPDRSWLTEIGEGEPREHRTDWAGYEPHSVWQSALAQFREEMRQQSNPIHEGLEITPPESEGQSKPEETPTERYHARKRAARVERIADLHKTADA